MTKKLYDYDVVMRGTWKRPRTITSPNDELEQVRDQLSLKFPGAKLRPSKIYEGGTGPDPRAYDHRVWDAYAMQGTFEIPLKVKASDVSHALSAGERQVRGWVDLMRMCRKPEITFE